MSMKKSKSLDAEDAFRFVTVQFRTGFRYAEREKGEMTAATHGLAAWCVRSSLKQEHHGLVAALP